MKDINIILTRHGRYNNSRDKNDLSIGHITEKGKREIAEKTKKRLARLVGNNLKDTTFLIIASPTYWLSDNRFGRRAIETEQEIRNEILKELQEEGISKEEAKEHFYSESKIYTRNTNGISIEELGNKLSEPNVYDLAPEYIQKLKVRYGGMNSGFWRELASSEEAKEYNKDAEGPTDLRRKVTELLNYVIDWSKDYSKSQDTNICVFLITHGETMEPFIHNKKLSHITEFGYNDGIVFNVKEDGIIIRTEDENFIGPSPKVKDEDILGRD